MALDYPLTFEPNFHPALWGGESWEISSHPAGPSVITNGELKGKTLSEVMPDFPLLIKVIDAKTRLSVQVHPNEVTRKVTGGEPDVRRVVSEDDQVVVVMGDRGGECPVNKPCSGGPGGGDVAEAAADRVHILSHLIEVAGKRDRSAHHCRTRDKRLQQRLHNQVRPFV